MPTLWSVVRDAARPLTVAEVSHACGQTADHAAENLRKLELRGRLISVHTLEQGRVVVRYAVRPEARR